MIYIPEKAYDVNVDDPRNLPCRWEIAIRKMRERHAIMFMLPPTVIYIDWEGKERVDRLHSKSLIYLFCNGELYCVPMDGRAYKSSGPDRHMLLNPWREVTMPSVCEVLGLSLPIARKPPDTPYGLVDAWELLGELMYEKAEANKTKEQKR